MLLYYILYFKCINIPFLMHLKYIYIDFLM
uniref:Uncharacterized protein n=1 Tax=Podoviridae sp. ctxqo3 TaxID=2827755 RepID=A0A8S5SZD6_9CAUD|nr:MAG TPA: hypothetical protein [Podoviridae sp. ctxqo3]